MCGISLHRFQNLQSVQAKGSGSQFFANVFTYILVFSTSNMINISMLSTSPSMQRHNGSCSCCVGQILIRNIYPSWLNKVLLAVLHIYI